MQEQCKNNVLGGFIGGRQTWAFLVSSPYPGGVVFALTVQTMVSAVFFRNEMLTALTLRHEISWKPPP